MNRIIFIILALCLGNIAQAQNANRSGFFIEAGIGGLTGTTPISTTYLDGVHLVKEHATGTGANLYLGYRLKTSNHFAIDFRGGAVVPFESTKYIQVFKIMPGIRYTSKELFKNISLYAALAFGPTLSYHGVYNFKIFSWQYYNIDGLIESEGKSTTGETIYYYTPESKKSNLGLGFLITAGLNLTNNLYLGASYDRDYHFGKHEHRQYYEKTKYYWGIIGAQIGYRF